MATDPQERLNPMDTPVRRVRRMAGDLRSRVEVVRPRSRPLDVTLTAAYHDRLVGGELLSCALAFRLFLWLLPRPLSWLAFSGWPSPRLRPVKRARRGSPPRRST